MTVNGTMNLDNEAGSKNDLIYCYWIYKLTGDCPCSYEPIEDDLCIDCDYNDRYWFSEDELKTFVFRNDIIRDKAKWRDNFNGTT